MLSLIKWVEQNYAGRQILLISHGDPLQILAARFVGMAPEMHRTLPIWQTAEIRPLWPDR
jgi:broad specificity phosphatase PhoE